MAKLTVKASVRFIEFSSALLHILVRSQRLVEGLTEIDEVVVTSANDSTHGAGSRHYTNEALDFRTKNFPSRDFTRWFRRALEETLGPQFRVLLEDEGTPNEHLHAQVRKGTKYIPVPL